jgi:hypothetical protein
MRRPSRETAKNAAGTGANPALFPPKLKSCAMRPEKATGKYHETYQAHRSPLRNPDRDTARRKMPQPRVAAANSWESGNEVALEVPNSEPTPNINVPMARATRSTHAYRSYALSRLPPVPIPSISPSDAIQVSKDR